MGLHEDSVVVDLHTHPCIKASIFHRDLGSRRKKFLAELFKRKFWPLSNRASFPLLIEGGTDVILSTAYVPEGGWYSDMRLARWLINLAPRVKKKIYKSAYFNAIMTVLDDVEEQVLSWNTSQEPKKIKICRNPRDLKKALKDDLFCLIHSVEGAHSLETKSASDYPDDIKRGLHGRAQMLENLDVLNNRGVAYLTLAHFYPNACVNPVFPWPEYAFNHGDWKGLLSKWDETLGLTSRGEAVVEKMLDLGMLIDISHCTLSARKRIYDIASHHKKKQCILATHSGAFGVNRNTYNLHDWELKWLADNGGVVGIIFMNYWLTPHTTDLGLKYIEETMSHMTNVAGEDVVSIGTDFDGFTDPPDEIVDASQMPRITKYLQATGHRDEAISKFLGGNALRLLLEGWKGSPV